MNDLSVGRRYQIYGSKVNHQITPDLILDTTYEQRIKFRTKKSLNEHYSRLLKKEPPKPIYPPAVDLQKLYYSREFIENGGKVDPTAIDFNPHHVKAKREFGEKMTRILSESRESSREKRYRLLKNKALDKEAPYWKNAHSALQPINVPVNVNILKPEQESTEKETTGKQMFNKKEDSLPLLVNILKPEQESTEKGTTGKQMFKEKEDDFDSWPQFDDEDEKFEFLKKKLDKLE